MPLPSSFSMASKKPSVSGSSPMKPQKGIEVVFCSETPAPARLKPLPVTASAPRVMPWKALVKLTTRSRPVTLRASFKAASTALVPVGPGNCSL